MEAVEWSERVMGGAERESEKLVVWGSGVMAIAACCATEFFTIIAGVQQGESARAEREWLWWWRGRRGESDVKNRHYNRIYHHLLGVDIWVSEM
jgi:hypothetical protein